VHAQIGNQIAMVRVGQVMEKSTEIMSIMNEVFVRGQGPRKGPRGLGSKSDHAIFYF
jgi:hypothetical protein